MIAHLFQADPHGRDQCDAKVQEEGDRLRTCALPLREHPTESLPEIPAGVIVRAEGPFVELIVGGEFELLQPDAALAVARLLIVKAATVRRR